MQLDGDQLKAVTLSTKVNVLVITGGPGTGKTTVLWQVLGHFEGRVVQLASPTAKAAKRLSQATGRQATTIHRMLAYHPFHGFQMNEHNPIMADLVVIDEMSMTDVFLFHSLLKAIKPGTKLIMVGDVDQLPSVGPGKVFNDVIESGVVPTVRLRTIHRQAAKSLITRNAHRINSGEKLDFSINDGDVRDMYFIPTDTPEAAADKVVASIRRCLELGYAFDQIQVLTPMKRGPIGTVELNKRLRDQIFNPHGKKVGGRFNLGDRVIQTKNNYDLGVFNGDIGVITASIPNDDGDPCYEIDFDAVGSVPNTVLYPKSDDINLILAYALTVHKSQGSEYPVVVMVVMKTHYIMLKRNLLYTGVTRGRNMVVLIGEQGAVDIAVKSVDTRVRYSRLAELLAQ